jgi:hypothetical protein
MDFLLATKTSLDNVLVPAVSEKCMSLGNESDGYYREAIVVSKGLYVLQK